MFGDYNVASINFNLEIVTVHHVERPKNSFFSCFTYVLQIVLSCRVIILLTADGPSAMPYGSVGKDVDLK